MKSRIITGFLVVAVLILPGVPPASAILGIGEKELSEEERQVKREQEKADIQTSVKGTLANLYSVQPKAERQLKGAAGFAVFNNFGMKLGIVGSGHGGGLAVNNKTGKETYMRMIEVQGGLGYGAKTFSQIFIFETDRAFKDFIEKGWAFGSQATAAAKHEDTGESLQEAIAIAPGVYLYQLTDSGLSAEFTARGTKYYKDNDLN